MTETVRGPPDHALSSLTHVRESLTLRSKLQPSVAGQSYHFLGTVADYNRRGLRIHIWRAIQRVRSSEDFGNVLIFFFLFPIKYEVWPLVTVQRLQRCYRGYRLPRKRNLANVIVADYCTKQTGVIGYRRST